MASRRTDSYISPACIEYFMLNVSLGISDLERLE